MNKKINDLSRRGFIFKAFSSCALCCFSAPRIIASDSTLAVHLHDPEHKFDKDSGMSNQAVFNFAFKTFYIPAMKELQDQIGKEQFIEMLKKASVKIYYKGDTDTDYSGRTLEAWADGIKDSDQKMKNKVSMEIIRDDPDVFEVKVHECLWAKTFREANASEIGYAGICYMDYGMIKKFNPQIELIREKTLMQGDDYCHFKWMMKKS